MIKRTVTITKKEPRELTWFTDPETPYNKRFTVINKLIKAYKADGRFKTWDVIDGSSKCILIVEYERPEVFPSFITELLHALPKYEEMRKEYLDVKKQTMTIEYS